MADHLRFDAKTGRIEHRSPWGEHMIELLQLNEAASVQMRKNTLLLARTCEDEIKHHEKELYALSRRLQRGEVPRGDYDLQANNIQGQLAELQSALDSLTGATALPPLRKTRMSISVHP